jgi:exonuclease SbcD
VKLLHTSDWHLGRIFHNQSLISDQKCFVDEILSVAQAHHVDGIVVAGDVFDRSVPPADAVALFSAFLRRASIELGLKVFVIAGNHDSQTRLGFASEVLKSSNIYISQLNETMLEPLVFSEGGNTVGIYLYPYLDPMRASKVFGQSFESQDEIFKYLSENSKGKDNIDRSMIVAHIFARGGIESDSEKKLVGGVDGVNVSHFKEGDYVALGHLHGYQSLKSNVYYSGTPMKYSFSEVRHKKSVNIISFSKEETKIERVLLNPSTDLIQIEGYFDDIISQAKNTSEEERFQHFYKFVLLDEKPVFQVMSRLQKYYPKAVELVRKRKSNALTSALVAGRSGVTKKEDIQKDGFILEVIEDFFERTQNHKLDEFEKTFFNEKINEVLIQPESE